MAIGISIGQKPLGKKATKKQIKSLGPRKKSAFKAFRVFIMTNKWFVVIGLFFMFFAGAYQVGWATKTFALVNTYIDQKANKAGMVYKSVEVFGINETLSGDVFGAMNLEIGTPLYRLDVGGIRTQIEFLPWVRTAFVSRQLPDTLQVNVVERTPYALWQYEGNIWLIDESGVEITQENLGRFEGLPFVVGKGAPQEVGGLMSLLATESALFIRVKTAIRVGERRWDVEFDTGARLRLPTNTDSYTAKMAWHRFAGLEKEHRLLGRDVATYDMRLSDRMTVQLTNNGKDTLSKNSAPT